MSPLRGSKESETCASPTINTVILRLVRACECVWERGSGVMSDEIVFEFQWSERERDAEKVLL